LTEIKMSSILIL